MALDKKKVGDKWIDVKKSDRSIAATEGDGKIIKAGQGVGLESGKAAKGDHNGSAGKGKSEGGRKGAGKSKDKKKGGKRSEDDKTNGKVYDTDRPRFAF